MSKLRQNRAHAQRGQSLVEYIVVCAALAFALFVPIQDDPADPGSKRSTLEIVLEGFETAYKKISRSMSLPG